MSTYRKRSYNPMRGHRLRLYGLIMARERKELYASDEKRDWILERYPPEEEWGRDFTPLPPSEPKEV